jgi:hypothetical protein
MFTVSLIIPIFMGCGAWALAVGAAPGRPINENYLALFGLGIASIAIISLPIPYIFRWNWETKYFGAGMLSLSSGSVVGLYPILCIAQYSSLSALVRLALVLLEGALIIRWCLRFANIYKIIYDDKRLFRCIYTEDFSAVYYSQQADKKVIEKILNFRQVPNSKHFIVSGLVALSLTPFATPLSQFVGIPFVHIFLAVFATPLNLMFLGLSVKGWLVFYFYPTKINKATNKPVYVDISSQPPKCLR